MRLTVYLCHHNSTPFALSVSLAFLVITFVWAVIKRPPIPESVKIENPHQWGFPEWYGKAEPYFDSTPENVTHSAARSVLLFIGGLFYDSYEMPHALTTLDALRKAVSVNVSIITPFSSNWDHRVDTRENLESVGCKQMDILWRIGDFSGNIGGCEGAIWISETFSKGVDPRANVFITEQPQQLLRPEVSHKELKEQQDEQWQLGLFSYVAPPSVFYPSKRIPSPHFVTYFPSPNTKSCDFPRLPWGKGWSRHTPSARAPPPTKDGDDPLREDSAYRKYWRSEEKRRAKAMRESGICLFEEWKDGTLNARMVEAMMSGCVVATFPPHVEHDMLHPMILPLSKPFTLSNYLPTKDINSAIAKTSVDELRRKSLQAFMAARYHFVPAARLQSVWEVVDKWKEGGRGYNFPHGFRWDCESAVRPPWCHS
nr:hypothetical protein L203_00422 [Cryptococcus depauperatus CBS 7841]